MLGKSDMANLSRYGDRRIDMIRFIPPNSCRHCEQHRIPLDKRTIIMLDHQLLCGYCGTQFSSIPCEDPPAPVGAFMRTLVEHGLFHMDPTSQYNPLTLWAKDNNGSPVVICRICHSTTQSNTSQIPPHRQCKVETLANLPDTVKQGIDRVTRLRFERGARLSMTMTDLGADRKLIRFEIVKEQRSSGQYKFTATTTRIEFSWTEPNYLATLYIPSYGAVRTMELLRTARNGWTIPSDLQLCLNRHTGESAARDNAHHHTDQDELFVICISCNPLIIGAALILDGLLRIGDTHPYDSLADWWSKVSMITSWTRIGPNVVDTFKKDSSIVFTLKTLGKNPHYRPPRHG